MPVKSTRHVKIIQKPEAIAKAEVQADRPKPKKVPTKCLYCEKILKSRCVREVEIELFLTEEAGGGRAPDIYLSGKFFCGATHARKAAGEIMREVNRPGDPGHPVFPAHLPFRGKIGRFEIHYTHIGPATHSASDVPEHGPGLI